MQSGFAVVQHALLPVHRKEDLAKVVHETRAKLAEKLPLDQVALWLVERLNAREACHDIVEELFRDYGTILTPAALGPAPKGLATTGNPVAAASR